MRVALELDKRMLKAWAQRVGAWDISQIVPAHGAVCTEGGAAAFRRAFSFVLEDAGAIV